jgi:tetratricopeptide (TPR) repeat protein
MSLLLLAITGTARAALPPPDYRAEVVAAVAHRIEDVADKGDISAAVDLAERFERVIGPAAPVAYEVALRLNRSGDPKRAMLWYDRTIAADPLHAAGRYDRGELHLRNGDFELAQSDFEAALAERPDAWAVHFRLAELCAHRGDGPGFEQHLRAALERGFDFREIGIDPNWRRWAKSPLMGPIIARYMTVYSDARLLDALRGAP